MVIFVVRSQRLKRSRRVVRGVMVGRGAQGQPWLLAQIGDVLAGRKMRAAPSILARHELMRAHLDDMITHYGPEAMRLRANILLGMPMVCRGGRIAQYRQQHH